MSLSSWSRQERLARWLLAPVFVAALVVAVFAPGHAVWGVDSRTYLEMTVGVSQRGLPAVENGDFAHVPEMRVPFNVDRHGLLWGEYPPLFPYVAALPLKLFGVVGYHRCNIAISVFLALAVFALARRLGRAPLLAAAAANLTFFGTPLWVVMMETPAMPLMMTLTTVASYCGARALEHGSGRAARFAALAGLCAGLAVCAHLLALLMGVGIVGALFVLRRGRRLGFDGERTRRGFVALTLFALPLGFLAALNAYRFGSPNPISYPCVWKHCSWTVQTSLRMGALASFGLAPMLFVLGTTVALVLARNRPRAWSGAIVGLSLALALIVMPQRALAIVQTLRGYFLDPPLEYWHAHPEHRWSFARGEGGVGILNQHHVVRALFQTCPIAAAGWLALLARAHLKQPTQLVLLALVGHVATLATLARFPGILSLGWPFLVTRYAVPAAPLLLALATIPARALAFKRSSLIALVAMVPVGIALALRDNEEPLLTRVLVLRVSLLLAALAVLTWLGPRRAAAPAFASCAGFAVAIALGIDARAVLDINRYLGAKIARLEGVPRLALVGWGPDLDPALSVRASADVEYLDLTESESWDNMRRMFDRWSHEGRPIFGAFPADGSFRWPYADWDVPARCIDERHGIWEIGPPMRSKDDPP